MACATWLGTARFGPPAEPGPTQRVGIEVRAASDRPADAALAQRLGGVLASALGERLGALHPERLVIVPVGEPADFRLVVELAVDADASVAALRLEPAVAAQGSLDRWRGRARASTDDTLIERARDRAARALTRELLAGEVVTP